MNGPLVLWKSRTGDTKTGPMPACYVEQVSCPDACALKWRFVDGARLKGPCYAKQSVRVLGAWERASDITNANTVTWETFTARVQALAAGTLWRYAIAGDLPGHGDIIDARALAMLITANAGKRGFTYTHKPVTVDAIQAARKRAGLKALPARTAQTIVERNRIAIALANGNGFTVNLSADNLAQADAKAALGIGPVAVVLPIDAPDTLKTPEGRTVQVCPEQTGKRPDCLRCGACAAAGRRAIIGFRAHGHGAAVAGNVAIGG